MTEQIITSGQNPRVKAVVALQQKASERRRSGQFVVEGRRELRHALEAGFEIAALYYCPEICGEDSLAEFGAAGEHLAVFPAVYAKMAYRESTEGVLGVLKAKDLALDDLPAVDSPLYMVLESVEKPGNLGAVLRSADAAQADAVILCDALADLYNPNLIRSSLGARFTVPVVSCTTEDCIAFLKRRGVRILTAQLQDSELYYATDMRCPTALVMGTESTGLTTAWREAADAHIRIPMRGHLDSLNVSVSAAILLFEAVRQRLIGA